MPLKDFDVIKVYPIHERVRQVVYLEGHVKYPREYGLKPGMRLLDIITSYDALLPEPYLPQAEIIRLMPPDLHPEIIEFNLGALMAGDVGQNLLLQELDRIIIYDTWEKKEKPEVIIKGAVRKPGVYRLYKGMGIKDLIFQAGNLTNNAYLEKATLSRVVAGSTGTDIKEREFSPKKAMAELSPDNIPLERNDSVYIREIPQYGQALTKKVYLEGEFLFPGEYTFSEGNRLSSVIDKAGGLTKDAYPFGATFYRESVKIIQEKRLRDYISDLEEDILTLASQEAGKALDDKQAEILKQTMGTKKQLLEKLKTARATGRMVIDLPEVLSDDSSDSNFELRSGDRLVVNKRPDSVNVLGAVYNPTALFAAKNKTVRYYLDEVGGATVDGDKGQIYVVKANGSVISKSQEGFFGMARWDSSSHWWAIGFESIRLDPGDTIIVPKKVKIYPWMRVTKDITQILYQIAVGAGVIVAAY
jgi:protein involved in polysaccharide export with SLBB domain